MNPTHTRGFTLIELLVVITIIVVLLSLLTPALDKAISEAELTVCAARIKAISTSMTTYAMNHNRRFPRRAGKPTLVRDRDRVSAAMGLSGAFDMLKVLKPYMSLHGDGSMLNCPLAPIPLDYESSRSWIIESSYNLWFGYGYNGARHMSKLGDTFAWDGKKFNLIAGDLAVHSQTKVYAGSTPHVEASHQDDEGQMSAWARGDDNTPAPGDDVPELEAKALDIQFSRWWNFQDNTRGKVDLNYGRTDGSVRSYRELIVRDERMSGTPLGKGAEGDWPNVSTLVPSTEQ